MFWIGAVALTACMFVSPQRGTEDLPASSPHAFFNASENCTCCHDTQDKGVAVEPHSFSVDIIESCTGCHTDEQIGRSHPVGVRSEERYPDMIVPESLPLNAEGVITCGTCHNPHLDSYSLERYSIQQEPVGYRVVDGVEVAYYRSYMLRLHAPEAGNDPTCAACHVEHL